MSKPTTITIDDVEYIRKDQAPTIQKIPDTPIGCYSIVRSRDAGVWAGVPSKVDGRNVTLHDARRLWYWEVEKGFTLSHVALAGIKSGKLPAAVPQVFLTEVCEITPCTEEAEKNLRAFPVHRGV